MSYNNNPAIPSRSALMRYRSVAFPNDAVTTLESHEHVDNVELDQEAKTQSSVN